MTPSQPHEEPDTALGDAEVMLAAVTDRGVIRLDRMGRIVGWSAGAQALLGYSEAEVLGSPVSLFHTEFDQAAGLAERELTEAQDSDRVDFEGWRVRKDGQQFLAGVVVSALRDQAGSLTGYVKVIRDLADDHQRSHPVFYDLLEAAPDAMVVVAPDGRVTMANAQADRIFGYTREELIGSEVEMLLPQRLRDQHVIHRSSYFADPVMRTMGSDLDLWGVRQDGTEFPVDISLSPVTIEDTLYVWASVRDITHLREYERLRQQRESLIRTQRELERLARIDPLTGLANHAETVARLQAQIQERRIPGTELGLLFCDADHFKDINDTLGHPVGDVVLSTLGRRIRACVRDGDTVGRIGGDEMLVLLPDVHNIDDVLMIAEKIRANATEPIEHMDNEIHVTLSIGATLAVPGETVSTIISRADTAMYEAKRSGRNTITVI